MAIKSGYATIIGLPNAGKSTLLNALLGEKLSITTNKPQTTRKRILGLLSEEDYQIVFLDTPGILKPEYLLQEKMLETVYASAKDADVLLFLVDMGEDTEGNKLLNNENVQKILSFRNKKKVIILNKVDLSNETNMNKLIAKCQEMNQFDAIIPVSATLLFNVPKILDTILEYLPEHPKYYPDDILSIEPERFWVSEIIREKIFELYKEEVPYSTEVVIEEFYEREGRKDHIIASIIVEKESQKPILIGKGGGNIKILGQNARMDIESFLGRPVYLELRVKVKNKWRTDPKFLKTFGYSIDDE